MNKDLNDYLLKFNSAEMLLPGDYQGLLNYISNENELSSKYYKVLDTLQTKLIKNLQDIQTNSLLFSNFFNSQCATKSKNIFDFLMNWLINIYYKIDKDDNFVLRLFLDIINTNCSLKNEFNKKSEFEENFVSKILFQKFNKNEICDAFCKISYIYDLIEKKTGSLSNEKSKDNYAVNKIKEKNKNILEHLIKIFDRYILDFFIVSIFIKIKNKTNFENERQNIKLCSTIYPKIVEYLYEIMWTPFYCNQTNLKSDHVNNSVILIIFLIILKSIGTKFFAEFLNFLNLKINKFNEFSYFLTNLDFSLLSESGTLSFGNLDSSIGHFKMIENFLYESITTENIKLKENMSEINEHKILEKLKVLKNLIFLFENIIQTIRMNHTILLNKINMMSVYSFYYSLQLKLIKNFVLFFDSNKKLYYENQVKIGNITKILPKYNKKYHELNSIISDILSIFYWKENVSLIFPNWLIFIYKNTNILESYKALRIFLLTKKEGGQIYNLLKMYSEIYKFFPCLWKVVLDSFLIDSSSRNCEENYNLISNLKFIFYYEISLNSLRSSNLNSGGSNSFYNSITYDCNVILKFFREKFSVLTSIFFSNENLIENILNKNNEIKMNKDHLSDMDVCFETYISGNTNKTARFLGNEKFSNSFESSHNLHTQTKIEILNILSFLLNTYNDTEIISMDIKRFILDLIDLLAEGKEDSEILNHIRDVFKIILMTYKKNCGNPKINFNPSRIIFLTLIKHLLNKIIVQDDSISVIENQNRNWLRRNYFQYFIEIFENLNNNKETSSNQTVDITNMIIYTIKELVYKNVDNQSFKNPIVLKNMKGLNDIDEKICGKEYLMDLLKLLNGQHKSFYGFYIRFLKFYVDNLKLIFANDVKYSRCKINLKKLFEILLQEKWLPDYYSKLLNTIDKMNEKNIEKFLNHISSYLKDFPPTLNDQSENLMMIDSDNGNNNNNLNDIERNKRKKAYKVLFKVILIENIQNNL